MKRVILHILCEGQTEEHFVKSVLSPYLMQFNVVSKPILLLTSKKKNSRGGMLSYAQAKRDLNLLFKKTSSNDYEEHVYTTMFDYYALPNDFPSFKDAENIRDVRSRVEFLESSFAEDLGLQPFIPYIQIHEFEALLFSDILQLCHEYPLSKKDIVNLKKQTDSYEDPEMINNSSASAPSKRIIKALSLHYNYNKVKSGAATTALIGIEKLLNSCPHFKEWVDKLTTFASKSSI